MSQEHNRQKEIVDVEFREPGAGDTQDEGSQPNGEDTDDSAQEHAKKLAWARDVVCKKCVALSGTPAEFQLKGYGIDIARIPPGAVGYQRNARSKLCPNGHSAMVAVLRDADGEVAAIQRTIFDVNGNPCLNDKGKKVRLICPSPKGACLTLKGAGAGSLLTEGLEKGLALHQVTGRTVKVSFGIPNFPHVPLAEGEPVTIVADNDEAGRKGAEDAARELTVAGHKVSIAIPPEGCKDANDVLRQHGADAVIAMVAVAKSYDIPADVEDSSGNEDIPFFLSFGGFTMTSEGLTVEVKVGRGKNATIETVWVSAPFEVLGLSRTPHSDDWGKWIRWRDKDWRIHTKHIGDELLQGDTASICSSLANKGLTINRSAQRYLVSYLSRASVKTRVTIVERTGWHEVDGQMAFVLTDSTIGCGSCEHIILNTCAKSPYSSRGSFKDWQDSVATLACGHDIPMLMISAALAGPLLSISNQESGGIHLFGPSSMGKSTSQKAGASVWGRGDEIKGYVYTWASTANGLEGTASITSDTALFLDEIGAAETKEVSAGIYRLANGMGKQRALRDGSPREPRNWRSIILSSGEFPLETKLKEGGKRARAGQLVRMLDIPGDRGEGFGSFNDPVSITSSELSQHLKDAAITSYGTAGPAFVRAVMDNKINGAFVRSRVKEFVAANVVAANVKEGTSGQIERAAQRLGLVACAGELAIRFGIVPWQEGDAMNAAIWAFNKWLDGRGGNEAAEIGQAIAQVRLFIEQYGDSRFHPLHESIESFNPDRDVKIMYRAGWRRGEGTNQEWWVLPEVWKREVCDGLDSVFVARTLAERGMLKCNEIGKLQSVVWVQSKARRVYALTAEIL